MKRGFVLLFIMPLYSYPLSFPGASNVAKFLKANKAAMTAKAKSTASTGGTATCKSGDDAQEELKRGHLGRFALHPSTWTAGSAATGSTLITNYFMKTDMCKKWIGQLPQLKNKYLKGAPEFILSIVIGMITFQAMYVPAEAIKDELLEKTDENDQED